MKRLLGLISILALASVTIWGVSKFVQPPESSESTRARLERAIHALQARDEKSFEAIRASFANDPRASEFAHFFDGLIALRKGMWDHAERELSQIEPSGEIRSFVLFSKAELLYRMSRLSEAEFALRQLLNDFEDHVDAHRLLGAIYYDLGSYDLAISHLGRVVELEPNSVGSHRLLGLMHHDFEQSAQACEHYRAALALSPPETMRQELIVEYAQSLIAQKEFHTALEILEGADRSQRTIALQARCLWNLNRKQEARKLVEHDSVSEIQDRFMCLIRLQILMDDRDWEQAVDLAVHYLRHDTYDAEIRYQLAQAYARLNRQQDYEREILVFQEHSEASKRLTELNLQAVRDPRDPIVRDQLAEICETLGKQDLAEMWRKAAHNCREGQALYSDQNATVPQPSSP